MVQRAPPRPTSHNMAAACRRPGAMATISLPLSHKQVGPSGAAQPTTTSGSDEHDTLWMAKMQRLVL
jgi:hypothetical protein